MSISFAWITLIHAVAYFQLASATVTQCYHCNSQFCADPYDSRLGAVTSCTEIYQNTQMYSNKLVADPQTVEAETIEPVLNNSESAVLPIDSDNSTDIETFSDTADTKPNDRIFDIPRKIWELFNRGEIDDTTQFVCAKAVYNDSGSTMTYRGCVPKYTRSISTACDFVNQKVVGASSGTVTSCNTCESNLCNGAFNVQSSVLGLVITVGFKVLFQSF